MNQIINLFKFLKQYNELLNPVITKINRQEWNLELNGLPKIKEVWSVYDVMDFKSGKILKVIRPFIEACPLPDKVIESWINGDWRNVNVEKIDYLEKIQAEKKD